MQELLDRFWYHWNNIKELKWKRNENFISPITFEVEENAQYLEIKEIQKELMEKHMEELKKNKYYSFITKEFVSTLEWKRSKGLR